MKAPNNRYISRKAFIAIGIAILAITMTSIYFLSASINNSNQQTYKYITQKNFNQKLGALQLEFQNLDEHLLSLGVITEESSLESLKSKFEVLSKVYNNGRIIRLNWFLVIDEHNNVVDYYLGENRKFNKEHAFVKSILANPLSSGVNNFVVKDNHYYWLMYNSRPLDNGNKLIYGITLDMENFHKYLTTIDVTTPNYAYIFTKDGLCIYHPEISLIGKNVFELSSLQPKDTITSLKTKEPPVVLSEYLNLEVFRFISHFDSKSFKGYITVNFPKFNVDDNIKPIQRNTILIFITTVSLIVLLFYFFSQANKRAYHEKRQLAVENEKVNKEKALMQLQQLKNQINPHFLFNSLNSLYMLIDLDPETAQKFTLNLSKTYRYLITPPEDNIVSLHEEITFIRKYITLQQIRFTKELHFELIDKKQDKQDRKIPYLALQITVENALKHNIATIETPLLIQIIIENDCVIVTNNYNPKKSQQQGELFGLKYLESIYKYYNKTDFRAKQEGDTFVCVLPLFND